MKANSMPWNTACRGTAAALMPLYRAQRERMLKVRFWGQEWAGTGDTADSQIDPASIGTTTRGRFRSAQRAWRWATRRRCSRRNPGDTTAKCERNARRSNMEKNGDGTVSWKRQTNCQNSLIQLILTSRFLFLKVLQEAVLSKICAKHTHLDRSSSN